MEKEFSVPISVKLILSLLSGLSANALGYIIIFKDMYRYTFWEFPGIISLSLFYFVNMSIIALFTFINRRTSDNKGHFILYNLSFTIPSLIIAVLRYVITFSKVSQANIQDNTSHSTDEQLLIDSLHRSEIYLLQVFTILLLVVILSILFSKYTKKASLILFGSFIGYCSHMLVFIVLTLSYSLIVGIIVELNVSYASAFAIIIAELIVSYASAFAIVLFCKHKNNDYNNDNVKNTSYCSKITLTTMSIINLGLLILFSIENYYDPSQDTGLDDVLIFIYLIVHTLQHIIAYLVVNQ